MGVAAASVYPSCPQGTSIVSAVCSQVRKAGQVWSGPGAWIRWSVVQGARGGARSPLLPKDCLLLKTLTILSSPCHRDADKLECTASVPFVTLVLEARGRKGTRKVVPADHRQRETQTCRRGGREKTPVVLHSPGCAVRGGHRGQRGSPALRRNAVVCSRGPQAVGHGPVPVPWPVRSPAAQLGELQVSE